MNTKMIEHTLSEIADIYKKKYKKKLVHYVCACDLLPKLPQKGDVIIIVNTDTSEKPGTHWQAVWITTTIKKERISYFFDSYGRPPYNTYIRSFIKNNSNKTTWNNKQIQSFHSYACGEYCCLFALSMVQSQSLKCFFRQFGGNFDTNDQTVQALYICSFNKIKSKKQQIFCTQRCQSFNDCIKTPLLK